MTKYMKQLVENSHTLHFLSSILSQKLELNGENSLVSFDCKSVMPFRIAYGGNLGPFNFTWTVYVDDPCKMSIKNTKIINKITNYLPNYSSRTMR